ncbi:hypothetical protein AVEN_6959-1 [Araneus ventricosus]|uniref:Transposable element Tc3 transposase n=1 Tax=Araneus ventricosus TaxID=182803 RepID=A0A4Y2V2Y5_ARAVE|nr:hypothetical protein AVEN_6959-1 [Araneus ventricosus]
MTRTTSELAPSSPTFSATPAGGSLAGMYDLMGNMPHTRRIFGGIGIQTWNPPHIYGSYIVWNEFRNVWFQHDGAPAHKTSSVKQYLVEDVGNGGFQEWPPRSLDRTPMDFFLWGYHKEQVYATPPPTLQDLQIRITDACANVTPTMLHRMQCEVHARVQMCIVAVAEV